MPKKFLGGWFHGPNGDVSSKRIVGTSAVVVASILAFLHPEAWQGYSAFLTFAGSMFIAQAVSKT